MKNFLLTVVLLISVFAAEAQILVPKKDYVPEIRKSRYSFGICLISSATFHVSFGIMRENPDSTHEVIFLTKSAFVRQAMGYEASKANPDKVNFFEKYEIDPKILNELWKLKNDVNPYNREAGWGTPSGIPSKAQFGMLRQFGISRMSDYAYGENLWKFLKTVSDAGWVAEYQSKK